MFLDRDGKFRAYPIESAVTESSGGLPQLVVRYGIVEILDSGSWVEWQQYGMEITAYLVLWGKDGQPTKNHEQAMKVYAWDGQDLAALNDKNLTQILTQLTVRSEEYQGKSKRKVTWIDTGDADPSAGNGIQKLDAGKFAELAKRFGRSRPAPRPVPAAAGAAPGAKPLPKPQPAKAGGPPPPAPAPAAAPEPTPAVATTQEEAWGVFQAVNGANAKPLDEAQLAKCWYAALAKIRPDKTQEQFDAADWQAIADAAGSELDFPF